MSANYDKLKQIRLTPENAKSLEELSAVMVPKTTLVNLANAAILLGLPFLRRVTKQTKSKGK